MGIEETAEQNKGLFRTKLQVTLGSMKSWKVLIHINSLHRDSYQAILWLVHDFLPRSKMFRGVGGKYIVKKSSQVITVKINKTFF